MGLILKWGSYAHEESEVSVRISKRKTFNEALLQNGYVETWSISGMLQAASQAALTTAIDALKSAYVNNGRDLTLYLSDGTTATSHSLTTATAKGGTRVISGPDFPVGNGAEYSTFRTYEIVVEAEYPIEASGPSTPKFDDYRETLTFQGTGGPIWRLLQVTNGQWQRQTTSQRSSYTVIQRGQAVCKTAQLPPPPPIWPDAEHQEQRSIEYGTPDRVGNTYENFPVSWQYVFESNDQLNGNPSRWQ